MPDSLSAIAAYAASCQSIAASAEAILSAAADHLHVTPEDVVWSHAEHAARLARAAEALAAEVVAFGGSH